MNTPYKFTATDAQGMDGAGHVTERVATAAEVLQMHNIGTLGWGIDFAIAAACLNAPTPQGAAEHLGYIIAELQRARANLGGITP